MPPSNTSSNGTLLAVAGGGLPCVGPHCPGIDVGLGRALVLRRSTDRGASWSRVQFPFLPFSNYTTVGSFFQNMLTWDSLTEEVVLTIGNVTYTRNTCNGAHSGLEDADGMLQIRSGDRGATWSKAEYLDKKHLSGSPTHCLAPTTGHGVCMDNPATPPQYHGRLVMVGVHNAYHGDVIILSDDHGKTYNSSLGVLVPVHVMHARLIEPLLKEGVRCSKNVSSSAHVLIRTHGMHGQTSINRALHRGHRRRLRYAASKRLAGCHHAQLHARELLRMPVVQHAAARQPWQPTWARVNWSR